MATPLLIDTDVLIDYLRDYPGAVSYVEAQQEGPLIYIITTFILPSLYRIQALGNGRDKVKITFTNYDSLSIRHGRAIGVSALSLYGV
jgi:hypothetical protein